MAPVTTRSGKQAERDQTEDIQGPRSQSRNQPFNMEAMYDNQLMVGNKKILARLTSIEQRVLALLSNYRPFAWRNR